MNSTKPSVDWAELQSRKLAEMAEIVPHFKDVGGLRIMIHPNVYPMGTDTNLMMKTVKVGPQDEALDIGTGTGAIACKLADMGAKSVIGVDLNPRAIENANKNKELLNLNNLTFQLGNVFEGLAEKFDVITINPPYTDKTASNNIEICFYDGGHKMLKTFFDDVADHLKPGGRVYLAWSNIGSMDVAPSLAKKHGFKMKLLAEDIGSRGYTFYVYELKPIK
jgi:release factor glutamine methyltransferase